MNECDDSDLTNNEFIAIRTDPVKGRSIFAKKFIPRGTIVLKDVPYVAVIDSKYKRNICNSCFRFFSESNRQNVRCCPGCGEAFFCSTVCQQATRRETRHTDLECKWLHYFAHTYRHQLLEDDKNIVLIVLRVLARRVAERASLEFAAVSGALPNAIPQDMPDLVDHIDEYFSVSLDASNKETTAVQTHIVDGHALGEDRDLSSDFRLNWQHDFSKLLTMARIIQNVVQPSKYGWIARAGLDDEGDADMADTFLPPRGLDDSLAVVTRTDMNMLKLLGKVRANYFGLWNRPMADSLPNPTCYWAGAAVYLRLSLFNHSCFPNCSTLLESDDDGPSTRRDSTYQHGMYERDVNPLTFYIVTLRDIEPDTELLITYIPLDQKVKERRNQLKSLWLFDCNCDRCDFEMSAEMDMPEFRRYLCPKDGCNGGMLVPLSGADNDHGVCRVCKLTYPLPPPTSPMSPVTIDSLNNL
eukprot:gene19113-22891_t